MAKKTGVRGMEYKTFAFKLDAPPDDEGRFSGSAAVFGNVDKGNDLIEPGATTKTIQENSEVPVFWVHGYDLVPIGIGTLSTDGKKTTRIEGQLFLDSSELAREVFGAMKAGAVKGLSVGYNAVKRYFKGGIRHLQEIAIGEVSLCPFPMNPLAEVDSVKAAKWFGPYDLDDETEGVDCLLSMIGAGADFMAEEAEEGDTADVARMQSILSSLAKILASEIAEVAQGSDSEDVEPDVIYVEMMSAAIAPAIKSLEALREVPEPSADTQPSGAASTEDVEPGVSTLRDLIGDMRSAASA